MRATFEVMAQDAPGLLRQAKTQADEFAAGLAYRFIEIKSTRQVVRGDGKVLSYMADVTIEVAAEPPPS